MVTAFRLHRWRYSANVPSGVEGRWNRRGESVLYAAATVPGAMVEILVHYAATPTVMCLCRTDIPDDVSMVNVPAGVLSPGWELDPETTRRAGIAWCQNRTSAVLIVDDYVKELLFERSGGARGEASLSRSQVAGQRICELCRGVTLGDLRIAKLIEEDRE